jgi:hypothetical protein
VYRVPPYPGWFAELGSRWSRVCRLQSAVDPYVFLSAAVYVLVALGTLWAVFSKTPAIVRLAFLVMLAIVPAWGCEQGWLYHVRHEMAVAGESSFGLPGVSETGISVAAAAAIAGSLLLVRLYGRSSLPTSALIASSKSRA